MEMRKNSVPKISDAEWSVMRVFWDQGEMSTGDVIETLESQTDWNPRTIQTLIRRLHNKGALEVTAKTGRQFIYKSTVAETECGHAASRSFLGRVFDGKLAPFVANFVENESVSEEEINELRQLLDRAAEGINKNEGEPS